MASSKPASPPASSSASTALHNLSNQSAFYIADAAKAFGQEDDITVLTVRRLAQAMAA